jgi:hypothetical protein
VGRGSRAHNSETQKKFARFGKGGLSGHYRCWVVPEGGAKRHEQQMSLRDRLFHKAARGVRGGQPARQAILRFGAGDEDIDEFAGAFAPGGPG